MKSLDVQDIFLPLSLSLSLSKGHALFIYAFPPTKQRDRTIDLTLV
jgi:hypothetical protein